MKIINRTTSLNEARIRDHELMLKAARKMDEIRQKLGKRGTHPDSTRVIRKFRDR